MRRCGMRRFLALLIAAAICLCSCGESVSINTGKAEEYPVYTAVPDDREIIILNTSSMTIHFSDCRYAELIAKKNKLITEYKYIDYFLGRGYNRCKVCFTENTDESNISED